MIIALALDLSGTPRSVILSDYLRSASRAREPRAQSLAIRDEEALIEAAMERAEHTLESALTAYLDAVSPTFDAALVAGLRGR